MGSTSSLTDALSRALVCFRKVARAEPLDIEPTFFLQLSNTARQATGTWAPAGPEIDSEVARLLGEIGGALAALDGSPAQPASAGTVVVVCLPFVEQLCTLVRMMELPPEQVAAFARCGALIVSDESRHELATWLQAVTQVSRSTGTSPPSAGMFRLSSVPEQLSTADRLLQLMSSHGGEGGLAAFAADVWPPQRVTRWLASVLVVMDAAKGADYLEGSLASLAAVCGLLLTHPAFAAHQAAITANLALQSKLVALAPDALKVALSHLQVALQPPSSDAANGNSGAGSSAGSDAAAPADGAAATASTADAAEALRVALSCLQLVTAPCLQGGVRRMAVAAAAQQQPQQQQQLERWLAEATALLQAMPAERPPWIHVAEFTQLLLLAVFAACQPINQAAVAEDEGGSPALPSTAAEVARLLWGKHAVTLLPHLARVLPLTRRDSELAGQLPAPLVSIFSAVCSCVSAVPAKAPAGVDHLNALAALEASGGATGIGQSVQLLASTAAVADAAVQLLHFAAEVPLLAAREDQPSELATAGAQLADKALQIACHSSLALYEQEQLLVAAHSSAAPRLCAELRRQQLLPRLRQLHTRGLRVAHYVAGATHEQLEAVPALSDWQGVFSSGGLVFRAIAHLALGPGMQAKLFDQRELVGIAVAEVQAQLLNLEMLRSSDKRRNRHASASAAEKANLFGGAVEALVLAYALQAVPFGPDEPARKALVDTLRYQLKNRQLAPDPAADNCKFTLRHAAPFPQLGAVLVDSGLLGDILKATQGRRSTASRAARQQLAELPTVATAILDSLQQAARSTVDLPDLPPEAQEAAQQRGAAADGLKAALQAVQHRLPADLALLYPTHLEEPARAVVAALEAYWETPDVSKQRLLALAQGAAARSCAYLRCGNVGAVGGAGAGEQEGSSRCSACRDVWYCGTTCSHADWRAGHRRTCKALAAARQMAKATAAERQQQQG